MVNALRRLHAAAIAIVALALSASLVFGAQAPAWAQVAHRPVGSTVGLAGNEETGDTDEAGTDEAGSDEGSDEAGTDESAGEDEDAGDDQGTEVEQDEDAGDDQGTEVEQDEDTETESGDTEGSCTTDPTALTPEELAGMTHGAIVCWAAQQTTWPEEFKNHGAFVSSWAHAGKDAAQATKHAGKAAGSSKTHGKGKGHGGS